MTYYEVVIKSGPTIIMHPKGKRGLVWDRAETHSYMTLDAARSRRDEERRKDPDAFVTIRDALTLGLCG